eukprot:CAMPEP_0168523514 /NCGR_PEP_ID=MMETSP0405-20121227/10026_1 /TAXON_ID=498012 /ORGANISM="Trichosphaerium sp, Strain Am-I-7 wt" /LENGTH=1238 /DNA_ID=CAMNT_0008545397 /DNA_START=16 /DNA_END=3733 /DNA_ORIENTATION=-
MASGTYAGSNNSLIDWPDPSTLYNITIEGTGSSETVIDGENTRYLFLVTSSGQILIISFKNIKFTRAACPARFIGTQDGRGGSVLYVTGSCRVFFSDCTFTDNTCGEAAVTGSDSRDNGILNAEGPGLSLTVTNTVFFNNTISPEQGLGVVRARDANVEILDCTFDKNSILWNGIVSLSEVNAVVDGCTFTNGVARRGSGIHVTASTIDLRNSVFENNMVTDLATVFMSVSTQGSIQNCSFRNNTNDDSEEELLVNDSPYIRIEHVSFEGNMSSGINVVDSNNVSIEYCSFRNKKSNAAGGSIRFSGVNDLTVSHSIFEDSSSPTNGGGMYLIETNRVVLNNCTLRRNTARRGGGIHITDSQNVLIDNVLFEENWSSTDDAGGAAIEDDNVNITIRNTDFIKNRADDDAAGIQINDRNINVLLESVRFIDNVAEDRGGGIRVRFSNEGVTITDSVFKNNSAGNLAGGIYVHDFNTGIVLKNLNITDNYAVNSGGGFFSRIDNFDTIVSNCYFGNNRADRTGGAVLYDYSDNAIFSDCTFVNNTAELGGGLFMRGENSVDGCTFIANSEHSIDGDEFISVTNSHFSESSPYDFNGFLPGGNFGNVYDNINVPDDLPIQVSFDLDANYVRMDGGSINIFSNASITITKAFSLYEGTVSGTSTAKRAIEQETTPHLVFLADCDSRIRLSHIALINLVIENQGIITVQEVDERILNSQNTRINNIDGATFIVERDVQLMDQTTYFVFEDATLLVNGPIDVLSDMTFDNDSAIQMTLGVSHVTWLKTPAFNGVIRVSVEDFTKLEVGDDILLMTFSNTSRALLDNTTFSVVFVDENNTTIALITRANKDQLSIVVEEKPRTVREWRRWTDTASIIVILLVAIGVIATLVTATIVIVYWNTSVILRASTREFLIVILLGILISYFGALMWIAPVSDVFCELRVWFPAVGFVIMLAPLVAKTYRIKLIFDMESLTNTIISFPELLQITSVGILLQLIILILWTAVSRNTIGFKNDPDSVLFKLEYCSSEHGQIFLILTLAYEGILVLAGCYFAFSVRNVPSLYNESKWMGAAIYNDLIWCSLLLICGYTITSPSSYSTVSIIVSLGIWFIASVTLGMMFVPKLWCIFTNKEDDVVALSSRSVTMAARRGNKSSKSNKSNISNKSNTSVQETKDTTGPAGVDHKTFQTELEETKRELEETRKELEKVRCELQKKTRKKKKTGSRQDLLEKKRETRNLNNTLPAVDL